MEQVTLRSNLAGSIYQSRYLSQSPKAMLLSCFPNLNTAPRKTQTNYQHICIKCLKREEWAQQSQKAMLLIEQRLIEKQKQVDQLLNQLFDKIENQKIELQQKDCIIKTLQQQIKFFTLYNQASGKIPSILKNVKQSQFPSEMNPIHQRLKEQDIDNSLRNSLNNSVKDIADSLNKQNIKTLNKFYEANCCAQQLIKHKTGNNDQRISNQQLLNKPNINKTSIKQQPNQCLIKDMNSAIKRLEFQNNTLKEYNQTLLSAIRKSKNRNKFSYNFNV